MTIETIPLTRAQEFANRIIDHQNLLGGIVEPCNSCPLQDSEALCNEPKGIQFSPEGKPLCPIKPGQTVKLIIT